MAGGATRAEVQSCKLRVTTRDRLRGALADEVVAASFLQHVVLRWDLLGGGRSV